MIDAASGGALVNKTTTQARDLIENMAANSQQFTNRADPPKKVNEVSTSNLELQLANLTSMFQKFTAGTSQQVKTCGICSTVGHPTDMCPTLQDGNEQVHAMGGYEGQQRKYDPFSNTYNAGWRDNPNFSYANQQAAMPNPTFNRPPGFNQPRPQQFPQARPPQGMQNQGMSLEEIVSNLASNSLQFQQETKASIKNLETQMGQLAITVGRLEAQMSGKLPSQTVLNPKENVSAVSLRNGRQLKEVPKASKESNEHDEQRDKATGPCETNSAPKVTSKVPISSYVSSPPFPSRFAKSKKEEEEKEILDTFRKVQVNIPLLDAIRQIPRYAKFLKELCTNKRKLRGNEVVSVGENVSAVIQRKLPPKCKDPGSFNIPCIIGNTRFEKAMLDLGASINVMPYSIYASLDIGELKETGVVIELAD